MLLERMINLKTENILGSEKISTLLIKFSIPAIVGMMVNALYNVVDRIFIGNAQNLGTNGIAGITIGFPISLIMVATGVLFGIGGATYFSINLGKKNIDIAQKSLGNSFSLALIFGFVIALVGEIFLNPILILLGASKEVLPYSSEYMRIIFIGTPFVISSMTLNNFIRANGQPKLAMMTMFIGTGTNMLLDPLFIYVFNMGMFGAAFATIISQIISFIWTLLYFINKENPNKLIKNNLILQRNIVANIVSLGIPLFLFQLSSSLLNIILNKSLMTYGSDIAISAMGITNSVLNILFMPVIGLNQGVQPIVSYNFGAKKYDRVKETQKLAIISATLIVTFGWMLTRFCATEISSMFTKDDELISLSAIFLQTWFICFPLNGFSAMGPNFFQATARPKIAMILNLTRQVLILIPSVMIFSSLWGLDGILYAAPFSDTVSFFIILFFYIKGIKSLDRL